MQNHIDANVVIRWCKYSFNLFSKIIRKMSNSSNQRSWSGVPLSDICGSKSPWGSPEFPLISASYNHAVLYHISEKQAQYPPKAQRGQDKWDSDHVRMPCSSQSLYPVIGENGRSTVRKRWDIIEEALKKPMKNSEDLAAAILTYNTKFISVWRFTALHYLFNENLGEEESEYFFNVTLKQMVALALSLPKLIQSPIPLLKQRRNRAISLSQEQISCLLANAFFCTFPRRNTLKRDSEYGTYPCINFNMLYESIGSPQVLEKLKCICHYFRRVCTEVPVGVMTFIRHTVPPEKCPNWSECTKFVGGTPLHVDSEGTIEDGEGLIQVDFANKFLGGGVLRRGCVQEEIRFVICPELLLSMLFTEVLGPTEALLMIGCERYSKYTGYGSTFQWAGNYQDKTPVDSSGRRRTTVLAIDAIPFRKKLLQYEQAAIVRELNKAWVGVSSGISDEDDSRLIYPGIATGNWGCGAFGGNAHLKSLLQLMACTEARRPMAYYTFDDLQLRDDLINIYNLLSKYNVTVGQLYNYIIKFTPSKDKKSKKPEEQFQAFLHQSILDEAGETQMETSDVFVSPWSTTDLSRDLFEDEEEEMLIDAAMVFDNIDKQEGQNIDKQQGQSIDKQQGQSIDKQGQKELKCEESTSTSKVNAIDHNQESKSPNKSLFDEMTDFDADNGKLNLNNESKSFLNTLNEDKYKSQDQTQLPQATTISETSLERKRKIGKKITDYFSKKSS